MDYGVPDLLVVSAPMQEKAIGSHNCEGHPHTHTDIVDHGRIWLLPLIGQESSHVLLCCSRFSPGDVVNQVDKSGEDFPLLIKDT